MKQYISHILFFVILLVFSNSLLLFADDVEHPVIKPIPGSSLKAKFSKKEKYSTYTFRIKENGKINKLDKGGRYWELHYGFSDKGKDMSVSEILENYRTAVIEKGGNVLNKGSNYLIFSIPREGGGTSWAHVQATTGSYKLKIIDEEGFDGKLSFGAEELKLALDNEGRIAIYGINFDINKSDLKLGAEKVISEIVKLMKLYPDLRIEIQGHTDNTGSADHNLTLSDQRAQTVKNFIMLYGINSSRLKSKGYGMTNPIDKNDTEEGRAKNRRVELVKI
jgi:outer membrane protein OmpA-like peptidoglycan-associated protein